MSWPTVIYNEEVMREGFGIEDAAIPLSTRLDFLHALSETGLKRITLGAFSSPRFVPQMAMFEDLLQRLEPREGVSYLAFIHDQKAREKALAYSPPLAVAEDRSELFIDLCDIHQRRNVNRSIEQILDWWPTKIEDDRKRGLSTAAVAVASAWGSNFQGRFPRDYRMALLDHQIALLTEAGFRVEEIGLHDSQSFCLPHEVEEDLHEIRRRWPDIRHIHLHMHNARGMALPAIAAALRVLDVEDTLLLDGTLGGIGGGQYCGNGTASAMAATEDVLHMLEGMEIETGVDLDRVIDCVWRLEEIVGHAAFGHVSRAGPRPSAARGFYDPNMPGVQTLTEARHFRLGPSAYADSTLRPWKEPIRGPWFRGLPGHEID